MTRRISSSYGLMVFSPDATMKGLYYDILVFLKIHHNIQVKKIKFVEMNARKLEALYGKQFQKMYPNWWIVQKLFELGPSIAVLLEKEVQFNTTTSDYLTSIKGSSDPNKCEITQLRSIFKAENRLINLIHTPDNHEVFQHEVKIFFSEDDLEKQVVDTKTNVNILYLHKINCSNRINGFFETLSNVKRRISYLILQETYNEDLNSFLIKEYEYLCRAHNNVIVTEELHNILLEQQNVLKDLDIKHKYFEVLKKLINFYFNPSENIYEVFEKYFGKQYLVIDEWELLILQSAGAVPSKNHFKYIFPFIK